MWSYMALSYRLTPVLDLVPILFFFLAHSSFCIFNHNQNQNAHKYLSCANFFSWVFSSYTQATSILFTHPRESLFVKMACCTAIVSFTNKYYLPNSFLLKKENKMPKVMPIIGPLPVIIANSGQSCRCPNFAIVTDAGQSRRCPTTGHSSRCQPESPKFKFQS
jgi:hypothetical protein